MDWLAYHRALIDCYEKIVRIPLPNGKILEVQGERPEKDLGSWKRISHKRTKKQSQNGQNRARNGKDKVKSKPKSVKVKSQPSEENTT
ncbi:hypothetical protein Tco_0884852 [Tanacetum coccineum]